jgi:hypothetical protein
MYVKSYGFVIVMSEVVGKGRLVKKSIMVILNFISCFVEKKVEF